MALFRLAVLLLLLAAAVSFAFYATTGNPKHKRRGLVILKWTSIAALAFFAGLALERLMD